MTENRPSVQQDAPSTLGVDARRRRVKDRSDLHWRRPPARSSSFFARVLLVVLAAVVAVVAIVFLGSGGLQGLGQASRVDAGSQARMVSADQDGASAMVEVALDELNGVSRAGGDASLWQDAYNRFVGQVSGDPWSTAFVVYCGDLCGFVESALMPHTSSASEFRRYFEDDWEKGTVHANDGTYVPQLGDIVVLSEAAQGRLGIVESYDESTRTLKVVEGDVEGRIVEASYGLDFSISAFIAPSYPRIAPAPLAAGEVIDIPSGLGSVDSFEGWSLITDPTSNEYQLRAEAGEQYDAEGFGVVDGRYVVAVRPLYGSVGDYLTFVFEDGLTLECIVGDVKGEDGLGVNEWGFLDGENILEFVVSTDGWYAGHENPGTSSCHPEWGQCLVSCTNTGNYWGR
ncbi:hypothetical protein [Gordonibacter sp.]|uniref:hypothetical protein n=1 Tax=Gordonibacter sp. TaxID=1968902 RepID=UPI002FC8FC10